MFICRCYLFEQKVTSLFCNQGALIMKHHVPCCWLSSLKNVLVVFLKSMSSEKTRLQIVLLVSIVDKSIHRRRKRIKKCLACSSEVEDSCQNRFRNWIFQFSRDANKKIKKLAKKKQKWKEKKNSLFLCYPFTNV